MDRSLGNAASAPVSPFTDLPEVVPDDYLPSYESVIQDDIQQTTNVRADGRIDVDLNSRFCRTLSRFIPDIKSSDYHELETPNIPPSFPLKLNIVIQVVGSRGDIQPFIALGTVLQSHGHRVRLATHPVFSSFIRSSNLPFFSIGGDPAELMAYMVRNPGLMPSFQTLRGGEIQRKRAMVAEMLNGCWRSCIDPDSEEDGGQPFVADAIIANPPSFAHVHCAQALGVPVHLMFTMPWTSTRAFSHPLANLRFGEKAGMDREIGNYVSYGVVEWLTWQGLGDVINDWRKSIDLEAVPLSEGPLLAETLKVPFTYCWSPALVAKPVDWPSHIDVCGFFFREPPDYTPPKSLASFLDGGPPPIYIGFGSIVIDDPEGMTKTLIEAVRRTGVRAIISRGWSKLGYEEDLEDILFLDDCPHEWLFSRVAAVIHHGGAGTTACGLLNGRPTTIVPFFGDQPFWGDMVAVSGAGPSPIPHKQLNIDNLSYAIQFCLAPEASIAAAGLAAKMKTENGVAAAVKSFHANLPLDTMQCDILRDQPAVWIHKRGKKRVKLSKLAASILSQHLKIDEKKLTINETRQILITNQRWDPVTGTASSLLGTTTNMASAAADIVIKPIQVYQQHRKALLSPETLPDPFSPETERGRSRNLSPTSHPPRRARSCFNTAGAVASAGASGVGGFFSSYGRGFYVDLPLAVTEGFRSVPKLYGEKVEDHEPVRDWKSGARVAGSNFVKGMSGGMTDLVVQPYRGGVEGGALGAAKGVAKGILGMTSKTASAALGIVSYPGHGIYQSIRTLVRSRVRNGVMGARREEGNCLRGKVVDAGFVLAEFERVCREPDVLSRSSSGTR